MRVLTPGGGHRHRQVSPLIAPYLPIVPSPITPGRPAVAPPTARLRAYIQAALEEILDGEGGPEHSAQLSAIYLAEMAHPTEALDQIVEQHIKRNNDELLDIVGQLLATPASDRLVQDAAAGVSAQILRFLFARPLISRLNPDQPPPGQRLDEVVERVWQFSLGGILALRTQVTPAATPARD